MEKGMEDWRSYWDRIIPEPNTGCLIWLGDTGNDWFPRLGGRSVRARAWVRSGRTRTDGHAIRMRCGVPSCVNVDHMHEQSWGVIGAAKCKNFLCEYVGCDRRAVVDGLCRLHYARRRTGKKLSDYIRVVDPLRSCNVDGCDGKHYGAGFCRRHYNALRVAQVKSDLISMFGGKCEDCKTAHHYSAMDFHHVDPEEKEWAVSELLSYGVDRALKEAEKCILLCANCHRVRHASSEVDQFICERTS
jgi:hypothetical protein